MKAREFGAWPPWNESGGGVHNSFDEYNRALKGGEFAPQAEEYASRNVEEFKRFSEQKDTTQQRLIAAVKARLERR